jgi:hypothetical protein
MVIPHRMHAQRIGCRGQGPAGGEEITAPSIFAGPQRRIRERESDNLESRVGLVTPRIVLRFATKLFC